MKLKQLFKERDAVSPVIGVILMVAITVILAAVIGAFVLGIGPGGDPAPTVSWDNTEETNVDGEVQVVQFQHNGGEDVDLSNVEVTASGANTFSPNDGTLRSGDDISVGDVGSGNAFNANDEAEIRIRWVDDGETTPLTSHTPSDEWDSGITIEIEVNN